VPVWYAYAPGGDLLIWTSPTSRKGRLAQAGTRISVCVQDPRPPYRYVSIEGPVSIEPVDFDRHVRALALRYLGPERAEKYLASIGGRAGVAGDVLLRVRPERWHSMDGVAESAQANSGAENG
jgi:hypothetical protein